jgi:hypothetical protein
MKEILGSKTDKNGKVVWYRTTFKKSVGLFEISYEKNPSFKSGWPYGRFGGGWDWNLGIQFSTETIILYLLVAQIVIRKVKKPK